MHSLPAMFTLPIRVRPSRIRFLTMLVALAVCLAIVPLAKAHYSTIEPLTCTRDSHGPKVSTLIDIIGEPDSYYVYSRAHHGVTLSRVYLFWDREQVVAEVSVPVYKVSGEDCISELTQGDLPEQLTGVATSDWQGFSAIEIPTCYVDRTPCFEQPSKPWWEASRPTNLQYMQSLRE